MGPDPTDLYLDYPDGDGSRHAPFVGYSRLKKHKKGKFLRRWIKPGKLAQDFGNINTQSQLVQLDNGNYRHIASFKLDELRKLKWDGSMYASRSLETWVPFIDGYDSDLDDTYEPFDRKEAEENRILGLPVEEVGSYMILPDAIDEEKKLVRLWYDHVTSCSDDNFDY